MKIKNIFVVYAKPVNEEQQSSCETVKNVLRGYEIEFEYVERSLLADYRIDRVDLAMAVGGDGTFLRTAHIIKSNIPLLGVNSDLSSKEGFYMRCNRLDFKKKFDRVMEGRFRISNLMRLEARINGRVTDEFALNEFYFGASKPYITSRYSIKAGGKEEPQRSSGVLVATPTGSMAWSKAAGAKALPANSEKALFIVREPFEFRLFKNYRIKKGTINKGSHIIVKSEMEDGILVADSLSREYEVKYGDSIKIRVSENGINIVEV